MLEYQNANGFGEAGTELGTLSRLCTTRHISLALSSSLDGRHFRNIRDDDPPPKSHDDIGSPSLSPLAKNTGQMSEEFTGTVTSLGCQNP